MAYMNFQIFVGCCLFLSITMVLGNINEQKNYYSIQHIFQLKMIQCLQVWTDRLQWIATITYLRKAGLAIRCFVIGCYIDVFEIMPNIPNDQSNNVVFLLIFRMRPQLLKQISYMKDGYSATTHYGYSLHVYTSCRAA